MSAVTIVSRAGATQGAYLDCLDCRDRSFEQRCDCFPCQRTTKDGAKGHVHF